MTVFIRERDHWKPTQVEARLNVTGLMAVEFHKVLETECYSSEHMNNKETKEFIVTDLKVLMVWIEDQTRCNISLNQNSQA